VAYLHQLSVARTAIIEYLAHGHVVRPPVLTPVPKVSTFTSSFDQSQMDYDSLVVQAWGLQSSRSVLVLLASATADAYVGYLEINLANWGHLFGSAAMKAHAKKEQKDLGNPIGVVVFSWTVHAEEKDQKKVDKTVVATIGLDVVRNALKFSVPVDVPATKTVLLEFVPQF
jgi:hypothetical protein